MRRLWRFLRSFSPFPLFAYDERQEDDDRDYPSLVIGRPETPRTNQGEQNG